MLKKIEILKTITHILFLLTISLSWIGCSKSDVDQTKDVDLQLSLGRGLFSATDHGTQLESKIENVRIMVFYEGGAIDINNYVESGSVAGFTTIPIVENFTIRSGSKIFCIIANEPASLRATLDGVTKFDQLKGLTLEDETTYNVADISLPFSITHYENIESGRLLPVEIGLKRSMGKVQMKIIKDAANTKTMYLKSVQVIRTPIKSTIIEDFAQNPSTAGFTTSLAAETFVANREIFDTPGSELEIAPQYLYEHFQGKGASAMAAATALKLEIDINGSTKYFEIPLIGAFDENIPIYSVVRNTIANLYVTAYGDRLNVEYNVLPWNDISIYDKDPGADDSNVSFENWIEETNYDHVLPMP